MQKPLFFACLLFIALTLPCTLIGQDSLVAKSTAFVDKLLFSVTKKSERFDDQIHASTLKYLNKLSKKEAKLKKKLARKNSELANKIFGNINNRYDSVKNDFLKNNVSAGNYYSGHIDSMTSALKFLNGNNYLPASADKIQSTLNAYLGVQQNFNKIKYVQQAINERQALLNEQLKNFGISKELRKYKEQVYYYRAQIEEYRSIFDQPKKLESTLLRIARSVPSFKNFFNKYSQLASLFRLPSDDQDASNLQGLQTRAMVMQNLDERLGSGPNVNAFMSSSMQTAQNGLDRAKKKINKLGDNASDLDMPNFRPNDQKIKSFFKRLEFGSNIQSVKSNYFFPVTTDVGLSVGYKLSSKAVAGVGASYKMGWGRDIRRISLSYEGVGMRTFVDVKIKSSFWLSAGGEMNYRSRINDFEQLRNQSDWQKSALIGISKKFSLSKKFKGSVQLLFDGLYRRNVPASPPVVFRTGYNFK